MARTIFGTSGRDLSLNGHYSENINDIIFGYGGNDELFGRDGRDTIRGGDVNGDGQADFMLEVSIAGEANQDLGVRDFAL